MALPLAGKTGNGRQNMLQLRFVCGISVRSSKKIVNFVRERRPINSHKKSESADSLRFLDQR